MCFRVPEPVQKERLIYQPHPVYPRVAFLARVQGVVRFSVTISEEGIVERVRLISGHPFLVQAAMDAVKQWRCRPLFRGGLAVVVRATVSVTFRIGSDIWKVRLSGSEHRTRMSQRTNYKNAAPGVYKAMLGLHHYLEGCGVDERLLNLVYLRASQINHCAYCIDMHWKDLRAGGESEQKLYMVSAWREWDGFTEVERAALEWTEALTLVTDGFVPDDVYERVRKQFSDEDLAKLSLGIVAINGWNRLNVAFRTTAGSYQPQAVRV